VVAREEGARVAEGTAEVEGKAVVAEAVEARGAGKVAGSGGAKEVEAMVVAAMVASMAGVVRAVGATGAEKWAEAEGPEAHQRVSPGDSVVVVGMAVAMLWVASKAAAAKAVVETARAAAATEAAAMAEALTAVASMVEAPVAVARGAAAGVAVARVVVARVGAAAHWGAGADTCLAGSIRCSRSQPSQDPGT
jgi:hypothetical protein